MEDGGKTDDLARRLAERVRREHGDGAKIDRLVLVASVTDEGGGERISVEAGDLEPYQRAGTLRHALNSVTAEG